MVALSLVSYLYNEATLPLRQNNTISSTTTIMSGQELAIVKPIVRPDIAIKVLVIEQGRITYDEVHSLDKLGRFPHPDRGEGLLWIHVPTNDMSHVEVSQLYFLCRSIENYRCSFIFVSSYASQTAMTLRLPSIQKCGHRRFAQLFLGLFIHLCMLDTWSLLV